MAFSLAERFRDYRSNLNAEFHSHVDELLENEMVIELDTFIHHYCFTRLKHSMDVAYFSFCIAKILRWDSRSVARAGLLHDLFLYDWRVEEYEDGNHASRHPKVAVENAKSITHINKVEEDIIRKHMWLVTITPPRFKEGYIVTFVDKYCASREFFLSLVSRSRLRAVYSNAA